MRIHFSDWPGKTLGISSRDFSVSSRWRLTSSRISSAFPGGAVTWQQMAER